MNRNKFHLILFLFIFTCLGVACLSFKQVQQQIGESPAYAVSLEVVKKQWNA